MKVSKEVYDLSEKILNNFEPKRLKLNELSKLNEQQEKLQSKLDQQPQKALNYDKWDIIDKQIDLEEKQAEVQDKDFTNEAVVKEMFGCSKDHSKEIDIYNKSYEEKIERVKQMKEEGNKAFSAALYDKASYYYAQALLIFHYLIPDNDFQQTESSELQRLCHLNQSLAYFKQNRLKEALQEIDQALKQKADDLKSLLRKASILLTMCEYERAKDTVKKAMLVEGKEGTQCQQVMDDIQKAKKAYTKKSKEMYTKMMDSNSQQNNNEKDLFDGGEKEKALVEEVQNQTPIEEQQKPTVQPQAKQLPQSNLVNTQQSSQEGDISVIAEMNKRLKSLEAKVEDLTMAIELIKTYGFNPKEYNEMMDILKAKKKGEEGQLQQNEEYKGATQVNTQINPMEKLQLAIMMMLIAFATAFLVVFMMKQ